MNYRSFLPDHRIAKLVLCYPTQLNPPSEQSSERLLLARRTLTSLLHHQKTSTTRLNFPRVDDAAIDCPPPLTDTDRAWLLPNLGPLESEKEFITGPDFDEPTAVTANHAQRHFTRYVVKCDDPANSSPFLKMEFEKLSEVGRLYRIEDCFKSFSTDHGVSR